MDYQPRAYTIDTFCRTHEISRSEYYLLRKRGLAPAEIRLGRKVLISVEAAAKWRERMEQATREAAGDVVIAAGEQGEPANTSEAAEAG